MNSILEKEIYKTFFQLLNDLSSEKQLDLFIKDFLNKKELAELVKRLSIIYWLKKGRDEENIIKNLEVNKKDIQNTKQLMQTQGVKVAVKNLEAEEWANVWSERIKKVVK